MASTITRRGMGEGGMEVSLEQVFGWTYLEGELLPERRAGPSLTGLGKGGSRCQGQEVGTGGGFRREVKLAFYKHSGISKGTELGKHELHSLGSKHGFESRYGEACRQGAARLFTEPPGPRCLCEQERSLWLDKNVL